MSDTLRRGLSDVFIAEVMTDDYTEYEAGTTEKLFPAGEMTRTVESDKAQKYFDNAVFYVAGREGNTTISITGADIRIDKLAKLLGKTVDSTTGAVIDTGDYVEKYFALGGTAYKTDGTVEKFWFLKGTFDAPELSDKTIDDSTDTQGITITFNAIKTKHKFTVGTTTNGVKQVAIDTETTGLATSKTWEEQVVTPENLSTIVQKKPA